MISFKEAKRIAMSRAKGIDSCDEYKRGYHFFSTETDTDGGFGEVVILKEDGRALPFTQFLLNYRPEKEPKHLDMNGEECVVDCGGVRVIGIMDEGWAEEIRKNTGLNDDFIDWLFQNGKGEEVAKNLEEIKNKNDEEYVTTCGGIPAIQFEDIEELPEEHDSDCGGLESW